MTETNKDEEKKKEQAMTKTELKDYIRSLPEGTILDISFREEEAHV